jgi:EAL domain-containing protein (putative c-di-GMP-specific phosphodiesterase class I)
MGEPPIAEGSRSFIRALARQARTRAILYLPAQGEARPVWGAEGVPGPDDRDDLAELERIGRDWLAAGRPPAADDGRIAFQVLRSPSADVIGALVGAKEPGSTWTDADRTIFRFAADFYGPVLDPRARPPRHVRDRPPPPPDPALEQSLPGAVDRGEMVLVYQPEVDLLTRRIVAVEALLRWQHPERGVLGPEAFIRYAERGEQIRQVGAWVIDESTRVLAEWNKAVPGLSVVLRVNVSPVQLDGDDLVTLFRTALQDHDIPGQQVCIELTENAPLRDPTQVADTLRRLKELGISSAIDDLATGYSTLSQLRSLPVDAIKIDRTLVSGLDEDARARAIVNALIGLALNFGLDVVAEGVENENEVRTLLELGCFRAQGHYLQRPVSGDVMTELLAAQGETSGKIE